MSQSNDCITACYVNEQKFWSSINILIKKPHVVNKRLWGSKIIKTTKCSFLHTPEIEKSLKSIKLDNSHNFDQFIEKLLFIFNAEFQYSVPCCELLLVELLPKNYEENHAFQLVVKDFVKNTASFYDITNEESKQSICPNFSYSFQYKIDRIHLETKSSSKSAIWLKDAVLPQVLKWTQENNNGQQPLCNDSLNLISSDEYYEKYNELKIKYGRQLVEIWPESTDPLKFVYEDVAIAAYLILLWGNDYKPSFVDIGCGNGLLVYILTMEGYEGIGVDVRKRKIWNMYPKTVKLEEYTIKPTNIKNFSKYEWIIGNHSDELTPWIPVIAAQSSYDSKFFLLPCCAYKLDGAKYSRQDSSISQYTEYLEFIKGLCENFGFFVNVDRLKIPSTKRICLVGHKRTYPLDNYDTYLKIVQDSVDAALRKNDDNSTTFKTRDKVERVRNCTQVNKDIIDTIVECVTSNLLQGCSFELTWSTGKEVKISDLIKTIPENLLKNLKTECGGLQTLLKNNHHIFQVINGYVKFRHPKTIEEVQRSMKDRKKDFSTMKIQQKRCWFFDNHPQGCPLSKDTCSFLHVIM